MLYNQHPMLPTRAAVARALYTNREKGKRSAVTILYPRMRNTLIKYKQKNKSNRNRQNESHSKYVARTVVFLK